MSVLGNVLAPISKLFYSFLDTETRFTLAVTCSQLRTQAYSLPVQVKVSNLKVLASLNSNCVISQLTTSIEDEKDFALLKHPEQLLTLDLDCNAKHRVNITPLAQCTNLRKLSLGHSVEDLAIITHLPKLTDLALLYTGLSIPLQLARVTTLTTLNIETSVSIPISALDNCSNLCYVQLKASRLKTGPSFTNCPRLVKITLFGCDDMLSFHCPGSVRELTVEKCGMLNTITGCEGLTRLTLTKSNVTNLTPFATSVNLRYLHISAYEIPDVTPLAAVGLEHLALHALHLESKVLNLRDFTSLLNLTLTYFGELPILPPQLQTLTNEYPNQRARYNLAQLFQITDSPRLGESNRGESKLDELDFSSRVGELIGYPSLTTLKLTGGTIDNASIIRYCPNLKQIGAYGKTWLPYLNQCSQLEEIDCAHAGEVTLDAIQQCYKLTKLTITSSELLNLDAVYNLCAVREVDFSFSQLLEDIDALGTLPCLEKVVLIQCYRVTRVSPLSVCPKLRVLTLDYSDGITDFAELKCPSLTNLCIQSCHHRNIEFMKYNPQLRVVELYNNSDIVDISVLASLKHLYHLDISNTGVTDITPLAQCKELEHLSLDSTNVVTLLPLVGCPLVCLEIERCFHLTDLPEFIANAPFSLRDIQCDPEFKLPKRIKKNFLG